MAGVSGTVGAGSRKIYVDTGPSGSAAANAAAVETIASNANLVPRVTECGPFGTEG